MMETMQGLVGMTIVVTLLEFILFSNTKGMLFYLLKTAFYGGLAFAIYSFGEKIGMSFKNPDDWLTLFTFALAVFETAHTLIEMINTFWERK